MKKCPLCGREYDNSMMFCPDDGAGLLYGPASSDEPATAILSEFGVPPSGGFGDDKATQILAAAPTEGGPPEGGTLNATAGGSDTSPRPRTFYK
jgi:hypothetical protein